MVKVYPHLGGRSPLVGCALTSGGYLGLGLLALFEFCLVLLVFLLSSHIFFYHLQGNESERPRLRRGLDRDSTTSSTRPRRAAPGRGQPRADYVVMDLGMVGDIVLRASVDTASPYNNKKISCCFCLNNNQLSFCFLCLFALFRCQMYRLP